MMAVAADAKQFAAVRPEEVGRVTFRMPPMEGFEEFLKGSPKGHWRESK